MPTVVNTELTSGVGQKWVKPVEADDVAEAIVEAMEVPRFDVFVPRSNGAPVQVHPACCRAAPARRSGRAMGVDKLMFEVDHGARRAYEERAAASSAGERGAPSRAGAPPSATPPERPA